MSSKKGQIWSLDFASAMVVLSFMLIMTMILWNHLAVRWKIADDYRRMQADTLIASDAIMASPGVPASWERLAVIDDNISAIGLSNRRNDLSLAKIERLVAENASSYDLLKRKLGLSAYELSINITTIEDDPDSYLFGKPASLMENAVAYDRLGLLNGTPARVKIEVWR